MAEVGSLYIRLALKLGEFAAGMNRANSMLSKSAKQAEILGRKLEKRIGGPAMDLSRKVAFGVTAFGAAMVGAGVAAVKMAADMETSRTAFTKFLGSAEEANKFLKELSTFSRETPFEFPELVESSKRLLAFGFNAEQIVPTLRAVGDAVAGVGGGAETIDRVTTAIGQMQAKGKVSAEEMKQLGEAGIPAWQMLADAIGVDIPTAMKMAEQGAISGSAGVSAVIEGMNKRFGGMMAEQSQNITGIWSNIGDSIGAIARTMGDKIVNALDLKEKLGKVMDWLNKFATELESGGLSQALNKLIPPGLQTAIVVLAGAIAGAMVPALASFAVAAWSAVAPLLPFIAAGAALAGVAFLIYKNWDKISEFFGGVWQEVVYKTQMAWSAIKLLVLHGAQEVLDGLVKFAGWVPNFGDKLKAASEAIQGMVTEEEANRQKTTLDFIEKSHQKTAKVIEDAHTKATETVKGKTEEQTAAEQVAAQKAAQLAEQRAQFEEEWSRKLLEETGTRRQILDLEEQEALAKAHELGANKQAILEYYRQKRLQLDQEEAQERASFEADWNSKLADERASALRAVADNENLSSQKRVEAYQQYLELRRQQLEQEKQDALTKAEELGASKNEILQFYAQKEMQLADEVKQKNEEAARAGADAFVSWVDSIATGQTTLKDSIKDFIVSLLSMYEKQIVASAILGEADAWAKAGLTFGASLANLAVIASKVWPSVALIEGAKAAVRGLATGGLVISPTLALIGEGKDKEAVLPLNESVFDRLANGIVSRMAMPQMALAAPGVGAVTGPEVHLHIGTLVADELGLKKLERELSRIRVSEDVRKGVIV